MNIFPSPNSIIYTVVRYIFKKVRKKPCFKQKNPKHFQRPYLPKVSPTFLSPQHSTFNHPIFPPLNRTTKKNPPFPGETWPELQGHPASSSSNPSPSTATFPRLRALSRPPVGLDPTIWGWGGRDGKVIFFFGQAKGNGIFRVFLGFFKGEF